VPISAGTGIDVLARLVLGELSTRLGQSIVIDNRPGASGTIGAATVAKSDADGYTMLIDGPSHTIVPSLFSSLSYDPVRAFVPVAALGTIPFVLMCASSKGFKTLEELVAAAKAKPGTLSYASAGIGTSNHLAAERFRLSAGFEAMHVPYRGAGFDPDLLSGRVDFAFAPLANHIQSIQDGQLLALAVAGSNRASLLPNVRTMLEAGYGNSTTNFWVGMFVPARTPSGIVERLSKETIEVLGAQNVREKFSKIAAEPMVLSPCEFEMMVSEQFVADSALARSIGLTAS
jgi:tripartite-type tricarboxylate transporter receptor subunit TctC